MPRYDFRRPRLLVRAPLAAGASIAVADAQAHYLRNVLRLRAGDEILVFDGQSGEWLARIGPGKGRTVTLAVGEQTRPQDAAADLHFLFAPLKHARLDYMVQKAVEMGVSRLQPVWTQHAQPSRVNLARMRANAIEAAEQCGILTLPDIAAPAALAAALAARDSARVLVFCDEAADVTDPLAALARVRPSAGAPPPVAVLIGPEGGFSEDERALLARDPNLVRLALGSRILRADTAAVAALALVQAALGDWR